MSVRSVGLYVHIPFCNSKCNYCDFYSFAASDELKTACVDRECAEIIQTAESGELCFDTVYIGGGTPTVLGAGELERLLHTVGRFTLPGAEITCEANPSSAIEDTLRILREGGVNRLSFGLQSASDAELKMLGRRHGRNDFERAVSAARRIGFENISADVMLGIPGQTLSSLTDTLDFVTSLQPEHISAYMLKIEKDTPFGKNPPQIPDEDETAEAYLYTCERLAGAGLLQYEISNFARRGYESRHNLRYWRCEEYLGVGPAAHSFLGGKRFYRERDLGGYLSGSPAVEDGEGGSLQERAMLLLRLTEGAPLELILAAAEENGVSEGSVMKTVRLLNGQGLATKEGGRVSLTPRGFLVSNAVTAKLLFG